MSPRRPTHPPAHPTHIWPHRRTKAHEEHSDYWAIMKDQLGLALKHSWEEMAEAGVRPAVFLRSFHEPLGLYHDTTVLNKIISAGDQVEHVAEDIQTVVGESAVGKSMFTVAWIKASRVFFRREIDKGIRALVDHSFDVQEVKSFKHLMSRQCQLLMDIGHKRFQRIDTDISFLGECIRISAETPEDEHDMRFACAVKGCCINSGQLPMMPWEALLFKVGEVPDTPAFVQMPKVFAEQVSSAREAAVDLLGPDCVQLSEMIRIMLAKKPLLMKLDRSFQCELAFLETRGEELLRARLNREVLLALPSEDRDVTLVDAARSLARLKSSAMFLAASPSVQGEIGAVEGLVCNLLSNYGPRLKALDQYSGFFRLVLKQAERFYSIVVVEPPPDLQKTGKLSFATQKKKLFGQEAIRHRLGFLQGAIESGDKSITLADLMPFKLYTWLLTKGEAEMVQSWIAILSKTLCNAKALTDSAVNGEDALVPAGGGASSSASGSSSSAAAVMALASSPANGNGTAANKAEKKQDDACVNMMKFFVGRSKTT